MTRLRIRLALSTSVVLTALMIATWLSFPTSTLPTEWVGAGMTEAVHSDGSIQLASVD